MTPEDSQQNHKKFIDGMHKLEEAAHEMELSSKALGSLSQLLKYFPDEADYEGFPNDLGQLVSILSCDLLEKSKRNNMFLSETFKDSD